MAPKLDYASSFRPRDRHARTPDERGGGPEAERAADRSSVSSAGLQAGALPARRKPPALLPFTQRTRMKRSCRLVDVWHRADRGTRLWQHDVRAQCVEPAGRRRVRPRRLTRRARDRLARVEIALLPHEGCRPRRDREANPRLRQSCARPRGAPSRRLRLPAPRSGTRHLSRMPDHDPADIETWLRRYVGENVRYDVHYVDAGDAKILFITVDPPRWGDDIHTMRKGRR